MNARLMNQTPAAATTASSADIAAVREDLLRFARLQLRDAAAAEDAVQEALLAALARPEAYAGRSQLKTWVFGILKHKIVDIIREQSRSTNASALGAEDDSLDDTFDTLFSTSGHWGHATRPREWGDPQAALRQQDFWDVVEACLTHLPANTARVFMMREFLEFETPEVCRELNLSVSNCHVILHRARMALRLCLERGWFTAGEVAPC